MKLLNKVQSLLPDAYKDQFFVKSWAFFNVPLLFWIRPKIVELNNERVIVCIPLNRRTKNHLNSMYFGVLSAGADFAGGILAMKLIKESGLNVSLVFKDFNAEFLKRAEGDTHFICEEGDKVSSLVKKAIESGERVNETVNAYATCPALSEEKVARFKLTLSLKKK